MGIQFKFDGRRRAGQGRRVRREADGRGPRAAHLAANSLKSRPTAISAPSEPAPLPPPRPNLASRMKLPVLGRAPIDPSLDLEDEIARLKKEQQRRHPGALLPGQRDPGRRRLHRRLAPALAGSREDQGRRHLLRRRALHGRDGEDPEPRQASSSCPTSSRAARSPSGCPADKLRAWKARHPGAVVVSYINCTAEVKALSDYIVTSSNAEKIVRQHPRGQDGPLRARQEPRALAREADRPQDGALAGQLHRPRDVQRAEARRPEGAAPRGARPRAPRVRGAGPRAWPTSSARRPAPQVRDGEPGEGVHRRHRGGHPPRDAEGGAATRCSSPPRPRPTARATSARS